MLFFAGMDVVYYTGGNFQHELDGMKHPLTDATCTKCHVTGKIGGFHTSEKHAGYTSECLGCHSAHTRTDEASGFINYQRWRPAVLPPCVSCHPALMG